MPNWTSNRLTLVSKDKRILDGFLKAAENREIFSAVAPVPLALASKSSPRKNDDPTLPSDIALYGFSDWYEFSTAAWGTKWDAGEEGEAPASSNENSGMYTLNLYFDTAWAAPIRAYEIIFNLFGDVVEVEASFASQENGNIGTWNPEDGECSYELDDFDSIPEKLVREWDVERYEEEEEEEPDEDDNENSPENAMSGDEKNSGDEAGEGGRSV